MKALFQCLLVAGMLWFLSLNVAQRQQEFARLQHLRLEKSDARFNGREFYTNKLSHARKIRIKKPATVPVSSLIVLLPFHRVEELVIGFGHRQLVDKEFHAICLIHWIEDFAQDPHFLQFFLAGQ